MSVNTQTSIGLAELLTKHGAKLVSDWIKEQSLSPSHRGVPPRESELRKECTEFVDLLKRALEQGTGENIETPAWNDVRELLSDISRSRGIQGYSPSETASFIFALKRPLFANLRRELGLYTTEVYQRAREEIISRQQQEMLELSTPVVKLWDGILALPMIGTLDSARTQIVMESLLQKIVETGSALAIIDITGVPTVDTLTAQHLLKTVTAARLMGAECIISGIRPQIAQTIVHLGVDLGDVITKASLADALALALEKTGRTVTRTKIRK
jgi:rsbT co-antagonist protein RsbR